jgi:parvulin-like peptidyl-prolyl isomerase
MKIARFAPLLIVALGLAAAGCGSGSSKSSIPTGSVAVVNGTPIAKTQFDDLLGQAERSYKSQHRPFPKPGSPEYKTLQSQALKFLVQRTEYAQKAKDLGVTVTDKQIEDRLTQIKKQYFGGSETKYQTQLKTQGLTDEQVHQDVRAQLTQEGIYKKVTDKITVSDAELKQYYDQHPDLYSQPASRDVRHILVKTETLANSLYNQLKGGGDFAALAKKYSQDPGSKAQGGKLTITKGQTVAPFDKVAFSLKTNELSKPVHTQYGWHVIQALSAVKPAKKTPFDQVKNAISQQLLQQKKSEAMSKWVSDLDKAYATKITYAAGFSPPATSTGILGTVPSTTG